MSATIGQIVEDAQGIIGEVAGSGVQVFSEDIMFKDVIRGFNLLFKKYDWDQYLEWFELTLDGTTGKVTEDSLENVLDFEDIRAVHRAGESSPLGVFSKRSNPYSLSQGTSIAAWRALPVSDAGYLTKKIQILPVTAVGDINVHAKIYPEDLLTPDTETLLHLDRDMLAYSTAFMALINSGLNPDSAELAHTLMETKFKDITKALSGRHAAMGTGINVNRDWTQVP